MALTETENNAYAKFLGDEQRALWYVVRYFLEWSKPKIHWASTPRAYWSQGSQILVSWRTCACLCTRGVPAHQNGALVRKARCDVNKDIKHVVKKTQD